MVKKPSGASHRISDLHESERPRERLKGEGAHSLGNAELLAILLRVGVPGESAVQVGQRLLHEFGGLAGIHRAPFEDLVAEKGIGVAKAAQIKAAIELGRRLQESPVEQLPTISNPAQAADLVKYDMQALDQEVLRVILLDTRNQVLDIKEIYRGSVNTAQVRAAEVFKPAVRRNATALIVVHNHPSGDPTPSPDDVAVTRELIKAGELIDVKVLDHIIIGRGRHVSMKERGLGFS
ncbi:MAG TPA: DNA repair protein RadC [Anaerolineales bacterium]|nr:DNA repair protein RadC [Anaerolineales bacterium]